MDSYHQPVLFKQVITNVVGDKAAGWYIDGTLGDGGYAVEILRQGGKVVGIDVDPQALERAESRFKSLGIDSSNYRLIQGNFSDLKNLILQQTELKNLGFKGIILDLGVSSLQLDNPERGFSFSKNGPLDMRMDPELAVTAADLVNVLSRKELYELFYKLGEEKYSRGVADAIVRAREVSKFKTTEELAALVERVYNVRHVSSSAYRRHGHRFSKIHPATKVFQALRIAVNDELGVLRDILPQIMDVMEGKSRIAIVAFHSLEDRIVKTTFKAWEEAGLGEIVTKKPITADDIEVEENPRSRSAKLRVFQYDNHKNVRTTREKEPL